MCRHGPGAAAFRDPIWSVLGPSVGDRVASYPPWNVVGIWNGEGVLESRVIEDVPDQSSLVNLATMSACKGFDCFIGQLEIPKGEVSLDMREASGGSVVNAKWHRVGVPSREELIQVRGGGLDQDGERLKALLTGVGLEGAGRHH